MLIYLHIAKTGGTTMLHYLERQCKTWHLKSWWLSDWIIPDDTECLFSHCPYGEPDKHFLGEHRYVTFLRDPMDRVVSNYYHIINNPFNPQFDGYIKFSLKDIVRANKYSTFDNGMVRLISGRKDIGNLPPVSEVTENDLERAKRNISTFTLVGFLNTFNPDLVKFAELFGWTDLRYNWYRKGQRPPLDQVRPDVLEVIREQNRFDLELVNFARSRNRDHEKDIDKLPLTVL